MRHGKRFKQLSRTKSHRRALMANLSAALITHKRIHTTLAKAKALRRYIEPLLTRAKEDTTHSRRMIFSGVRNKEAVKTLFDEVAKRIAERPGGYTRILRTGYRAGDHAEMCLIELVDYNENMLKTPEAKPEATKKKRTRRAGSSSKRGSRGRGKQAKSEEQKGESADTDDNKNAAKKTESKTGKPSKKENGKSDAEKKDSRKEKDK